MSEEVRARVQELNREDVIWIIYIGIIILSFISNHYERKFFVNNDENSKTTYRNILIIIFFILVIVYLYFLKRAWDDLRNLKDTDSERKKTFVILSFVGSLFIAISGAIFLFIAFADENLDIELAFN